MNNEQTLQMLKVLENNFGNLKEKIQKELTEHGVPGNIDFELPTIFFRNTKAPEAAVKKFLVGSMENAMILSKSFPREKEAWEKRILIVFD